MLFLMGINLYTSRVILSELGETDFGIYNVVGGVVAMFTMLSGSLSAAVSRFITYELGTGNKKKLKQIFSSAVTIQMLMALIIIILAETIGVWFLNNKIVIPMDRLSAANWVLQFSIITFAVNLISIPYNAAIIAHEKMSTFAYISIVEAVGKLAIAYFIMISPIDRLVFYAILMFSIALVIRLIYGTYCKRKFEECSYQFIWNKELLENMFSFAGWNIIGASSSILRDQGGNIVINLFCGPAVNAARGIAYQVHGAVQGFVFNFMTALNPQITKSYATGNLLYMMTLIYQGARYSFYMLLLLSLPIIINTEYILSIWLEFVPEHTVLFVQLILLFSVIDSISGPLITAMLATGNIRNYQIVVGGLQMINLPISYVLLRMGYIPETVVIVAIVISQFCLAARLWMLKSMIGLKVREYLKKVYLNVYVVSIFAASLPSIFVYFLDESFYSFVALTLLCVLTSSLSIFYVGCNQKERSFIVNNIRKIIHKK